MNRKFLDSHFRPILTLAVWVLLNLSSISCQEEPSHAIPLTTIDFNTEIGSNNYFVMFYAPWCSYCIKLKPTWEELAEMLNEPGSRVKIAKVDCTTESEICRNQEVTSYPTLLYYKKGQNTPQKYSGTRDLSTLANFLNDQLGTNVVDQGADALRPPGPVELTDETYSDHLASGRHFVKFYAPWCGHCQALAPTWENIGVVFSPYDSLTIGKVDCTVQKEVCAAYEIKSYPTLLWIENGVVIDIYKGVRTAEELKNFIEEKMASPVKIPDVETEKKPEEAPVVTHLIGDTFNEGIQKGLTFVKYFAPWCGHCKGLAPTWRDLGEKFYSREDVTIADVDCTRDENRKLCYEQDVDGFPTLILYRNGEKIDKYVGTRTLSDLLSFVGKHVSDSSEFIDHDEL